MGLTIREFHDLYKDEKSCLAEIISRKGFVCGGCNSSEYFINKKKRAVCKSCLKSHSILKGTLFQGSKTDLRNWFYALYSFSRSKTGVSAKQLQRDTGMAYSTCFYMLHKIREMVKEKRKLSGVVEVDETYIGGKAQNRARAYYSGRDKRKKEVIFGALERGGHLVVKSIPDNKKTTLLPEIKNYIEPGSQIYTDELESYQSLKNEGYKHDFIKHKFFHVRGDVHTQNIEGFWSQFKRGVTGVYRQVSSKYVESYADEFAFRYNYRLAKDLFSSLLDRSLKPDLLAH